MGKPKASKKRVVKKKAEEVVDNVAVSDNDSAVDEPTKNGDAENSEDDLHEDDASENEVEEKVKGRSGRGRSAAGGKKEAPKSAKGKIAAPKSAKGKKRGRTTTPAPAKKSKNDEETDVKSDEEDDKEYEVEKILEVRFRKGGKREFSIQWKGYGPKNATWEPEENLECQDLLDNFLAKLGDDDVPRSRRLSSRPSTIRSTRMSETRDIGRVISGRVRKGSATKTVVKSSSSILGEFQKLNGESLLASSSNNVKKSSVSKNNGIKTENKISSVNEGAPRQGGRSLIRAALLSCGMAVSVGAALLFSNSSTINWDGVQGDVYHFIHSLRHKLEDLAATATQQSVESVNMPVS